jgi:hypothetical protein
MVRLVGELLFNRLDDSRPLSLPEQPEILERFRRENDVKPHGLHSPAADE